MDHTKNQLVIRNQGMDYSWDVLVSAIQGKDHTMDQIVAEDYDYLMLISSSDTDKKLRDFVPSQIIVCVSSFVPGRQDRYHWENREWWHAGG